MTGLDLDAIRARLEGITPGPWAPEPVDGLWGPEGDEARANSEFIAHAREDVPALLAEVESLRREVAADDEILAHRQRLIDAVDAIEECRAHGSGCVPHAVQWVERTAAEVAQLRRQLDALTPSVGQIWHWEPMESHASTRLVVLEVKTNEDGETWIRAGQPYRLGRQVVDGTETWNELGRWVEACVLVEG